MFLKYESEGTLPDLKEIGPGDHICLIYDNEEDHRNVIVPYVRQGLEQNQKILFVTAQSTAEVIVEYLDQYDDFSVRPYVESGQLTALSARETYFGNGTFDPEKMIATLAAETDRAIAEGYTALRITGEMSWALGDVIGADRLVEYEIKLNEFYPHSRALTICQYDSRRFSPEIIMDVLQAHPLAILGTEFCENVYYMPPEELLSERAFSFRLQRWIKNLKRFQSEREALQAAIREKSQLMHEMNHRIKNNLGLVSSMIRLKEGSAQAGEAINLEDVHGFVQSISLVHDQLYRDGTESTIDFSSYVADLVRDILSIHTNTPVDLHCSIPDIEIDAERAKNLGLIINELVTNALKHGFNGHRDPRICIELVADAEAGRNVLTVSNNGHPIPEQVTLDGSSSGGLGLKLISSFVGKLRGEIELNRAPSPEFSIWFPSD